MARATTVEYACIVEGDLSLHIAQPRNDGSNSNHYAVVFEQRSGTSIACIVGDWEYESFFSCLTQLGEYITQNGIPSSKRIAVGRFPKSNFFIPASIELRRPSDGGLFRLTFVLDNIAQEPHFQSLYQHRAPKKVDEECRLRCKFQRYLRKQRFFTSIFAKTPRRASPGKWAMNWL